MSAPTKQTWFKFGDEVVIRAAAIDFAGLDGVDLNLIVNGSPQIITSIDEDAARERFDIIQAYAGFTREVAP